jgi:hypothetical protein
MFIIKKASLRKFWKSPVETPSLRRTQNINLQPFTLWRISNSMGLNDLLWVHNQTVGSNGGVLAYNVNPLMMVVVATTETHQNMD